MKSTVAEREAFRKRLEKLIPQMEKARIVDHFVIEGMVRRTMYDKIKRLEIEGSIKNGKFLGRSS